MVTVFVSIVVTAFVSVAATARDVLSATVSLVLRLIGRYPDPAKSREYVLVAVLAEQRLHRGEPASLAARLDELATPPIERVGALTIDAFLPKSERRSLPRGRAKRATRVTRHEQLARGATLDVGVTRSAPPLADPRTSV